MTVALIIRLMGTLLMSPVPIVNGGDILVCFAGCLYTLSHVILVVLDLWLGQKERTSEPPVCSQ